MTPEKYNRLQNRKTQINRKNNLTNKRSTDNRSPAASNPRTPAKRTLVARGKPRPAANKTNKRPMTRKPRSPRQSKPDNYQASNRVKKPTYTHRGDMKPVAILDSIANSPTLRQKLEPGIKPNEIAPAIKKYSFGPVRNQKLKVIVVGGNEEVGRNMTLIEYEDDILLIDMGLQFPEESMPGIDYVIPNISYLKGKEKNIRGVIITHGHYDHIGGISHIMPQIGNPPIYMGKLTAGLVKARHEEFKNVPPLKVNTVNSNSKFKVSKNFYVELCHVTHTIPDCFGIAIYTPVGMIFHTGDFKLDFNPINEPPADLQKYAELGKEGVLALMIDSTNATEPGHQLSEIEVAREIENIFVTAPGRLIIGTFASLLSRVQIMFALAEKYGKRVLLEGRSMKKNVEIAHELGYLKLKPGILVDENEDPSKIPDNKLVIIGTGAQAQDRAFLTRFANGEHRSLSVKPKDTIVFSSSVIPGNERTVSALKDTFARKGAKVVHYKMMDVHAGGHARQEDLKLMMRLMTPKYVVPIEQSQHVLQTHAEVAALAGIDQDNIFVPINGQIMEFTRHTGKLTDKKINSEYIFVDGLDVGDQSHVVLRDRQMMAQDGMLVVIGTVEASTGKLIGSPDIVSRGFIYMKENKKLIETTRAKVKKILDNQDPKSRADESYLKGKLRNELGDYLYKQTKKRPMVLPVIITV